MGTRVIYKLSFQVFVPWSHKLRSIYISIHRYRDSYPLIRWKKEGKWSGKFHGGYKSKSFQVFGKVGNRHPCWTIEAREIVGKSSGVESWKIMKMESRGKAGKAGRWKKTSKRPEGRRGGEKSGEDGRKEVGEVGRVTRWNWRQFATSTTTVFSLFLRTLLINYCD